MLAHSVDAASLVMAFLLAIFIPRLIRPFITYTPNIEWKAAVKTIFCGVIRHCDVEYSSG